MAPRRDWIVYIVDDDDDVRDSTAELLQDDGYEVVGFASGREFLAKFEPAKGLGIILDLHMPDISGLQVLDALHARGNTVPVILFSGRSDFTADEFAHRADVIAVLAKPVDPDRMIDVVQNLLAERLEESSLPAQASPFAQEAG